ncbi:hypothetical protein [Granulicella sp. S156]|uniref:hypothetical protein n=1 Tax=Granulicella sp. S156 TaxID=1747224 RepID=UPI00131B1ED3|nr:hypothetical protein [Granulicella sp. S156]
MQDLLSFVQTHARDKRENLAGEVLALLLREEAGQGVLRSLIDTSSLDTVPIEVETQKGSAGCIPDIHLIQHGRTVALLELKFWASLTNHQLSGRYFEVAPRVIFIAPSERLLSLREELSELISKHSLVVLSWNDLLHRLEDAVVGDGAREERLFSGALEHLKEFCNVIEQEHFIPFTNDQLRNPIQDESIRHLVWLTSEVIASATTSQLIRESGRLGAGYDSFFFYGQNVLLRGFRVWLGYWPYAWKRSPSSGPLWVQFHGRDATTLALSGCFRDGIRAQGNDLAFPLYRSDNVVATSQQEEVQRVMDALILLANRLPLAAVEVPSDALL